MHISLVAEKIFNFNGFAVNNSLFAAVIVSAIMIVLFGLAARRVTLKPRSKLAQAVEAVFEALLTMIENVTHSREKALRFFPLLATLFIFIVLNNWLGLLPGVGTITIKTAEGSVPLLRGSNADLNATLALAIISVVMTQVYAMRELGIGKHLSKYFSTNPIMTFVGILEIISEFSKMISFSFRLFGNIFAGEVLLIVIAALVPLGAPLPFFGLEIFVGLIQALVFTTLSLVFLEIASSDHSGHGEAEHHDAHQPHIEPAGAHGG